MSFWQAYHRGMMSYQCIISGDNIVLICPIIGDVDPQSLDDNKDDDFQVFHCEFTVFPFVINN